MVEAAGELACSSSPPGGHGHAALCDLRAGGSKEWTAHGIFLEGSPCLRAKIIPIIAKSSSHIFSDLFQPLENRRSRRWHDFCRLVEDKGKVLLQECGKVWKCHLPCLVGFSVEWVDRVRKIVWPSTAFKFQSQFCHHSEERFGSLTWF